MGSDAEYVPIAKSDSENDFQEKQVREVKGGRWFCLSNITLLCFHFLVLALYSTIFIFKLSSTNERCTRQLSTWSPALSVIKYGEETMDGRIYGMNDFRGPPSPEIDEAWRRISVGIPGIRVYENELRTLNRSTEVKKYHKLPEENGGGYLAMLEVFHLLHCLDSIRKWSYKEHYADIYVAENATNRGIHTDHCIDILRQHLMCSSDVVPIVFYDDPSQELPLPDFSTLHKCRNFDELVEWSHVNERVVEWDQIGVPLKDQI